MIAAKKLASDELTAWREPARDESTVSISFPNLLSMRPSVFDVTIEIVYHSF